VTVELRAGTGRSHLCAYLLRTDVVRRVGGFRAYFVTAEDADFQYRLGEATRVWYEPTVAYHYRLHDASITHVQKSNDRAFFEQMARAFQQQRLANGQDDLQLGRAPAPPVAPAADAVAGAETSSAARIQRLLLGQAWSAHADGQRRRALSAGWRACLTRPQTLSAWRSLIALAVKPASPGKRTAV
jgi:hypothetical protein